MTEVWCETDTGTATITLEDGSGNDLTTSCSCDNTGDTGNTCTLTGNIAYTDGELLDLLSRDFEGDSQQDYIDFGDHAEFTFNTAGDDDPFSVVVWVNRTGGSWLVGKYTADVSIAVEWLMGSHATKSWFTLRHSDNTVRIERETTVALGTGWHHIAGTYSGNEASTGINIYHDGVVVDDTDDNSGSYTGMSDTSTPLYLGCINSSTGLTCGTDATNLWDGAMAYFAVYDRELSAVEVNELMWCPNSIPDGRIIYTTLIDESTIDDISGSATQHNGTNNGTATLTDGPPVSLSCAGGN
ncbi:MAG: LamG-like jellyroll fold domain-containing protein [Planctomycetota bacterium]